MKKLSLSRSRSAQSATAPAAAVFAALLAAGCSDPGHTPILDCEPGDGITPDCRFKNPEDIVVSPSGQHLIVSQMGSLEKHTPGSLVAFTPATGDIRVLVPAAVAPPPTPHTATWGDPDCEPVAPADLSPHGIDIERRTDGAAELFVVNHGRRESIELFEVIEVGDTISLESRGCVLAPTDAYPNDVVGLRSGDFWMSHMYPTSSNQTVTLLRMMLTGHSPGRAYAWTRGSGFEVIGGSETKFANGVEKSADERHLFLNNYFGDEVVKIDVAAGKRLGAAKVASPDNLTWSPTGELLAASHHATLRESMVCLELESGSCGFRFAVVAIDTDSMTPRTVFEHTGAPMGAATVALPHGDTLYLGTFAGDRMARMDAAVLEKK